MWPSLVSDDPTKASDRVSKKFQHFRKARGVTGAGKVFHSLRKAFISYLAEAGAQEAQIAQTVGHEHNQITFSVYNPEGFPLSHCKRLVDEFEVDGLSPADVIQMSLASRRSR